METEEPQPVEETPVAPHTPEDDLTPDADEPGDTELSPEIADLATDEKPAPDEVNQRPVDGIDV